jgi:hypothetical protein
VVEMMINRYTVVVNHKTIAPMKSDFSDHESKALYISIVKHQSSVLVLLIDFIINSDIVES